MSRATRPLIELGIAALFAVLAVLHTFPVVLHLGTCLAGGALGDNAAFV